MCGWFQATEYDAGVQSRFADVERQLTGNLHHQQKWKSWYTITDPICIAYQSQAIMAQTISSPVTATSTIPYIYRFLLLNMESLFAANGAILLLFKPGTYLATMTRGVTSTMDPSVSFINTELAGGWLHFAFTEAMVLRLVDDLRVWRLLCIGMILSDIAYCHSCAEAVGGWHAWLVVADWTIEDWVVAITTWPFFLVRLAIVFGIGVKDADAKPRKE